MSLDLSPLDEGDDVLTREEAARFLKITTRTLDRRVKEGAIPSGMIGRTRRFSKSVLRDLVRGSGQPMVSEPPPRPVYRTRTR